MGLDVEEDKDVLGRRWALLGFKLRGTPSRAYMKASEDDESKAKSRPGRILGIRTKQEYQDAQVV